MDGNIPFRVIDMIALMIWRYVVFSIGTYSSGDIALLVDILVVMYFFL